MNGDMSHSTRQDTHLRLLCLQMGRSLLCRLTWLWRPSSRHAAQGDPVQQKRGQQTPFGVPCLFSEALNSAQQSVVGLLGAHNSGDHREEASSGPERFLLLRSLQIIRDLLLYGEHAPLAVAAMADVVVFAAVAAIACAFVATAPATLHSATHVAPAFFPP